MEKGIIIMKETIIKICIIGILLMLLFNNVSFAKYKYVYQFNAMELSYTKPKTI